MTDGFTALLFGIGFGGWVYFKLTRYSGHHNSALTAAVLAGLAVFFVVFSLLKWVLGW